MEGEVEAINADPTPLEKLDVDTIVDHYEGIIRGLDNPPIIMGHSFGGGFTQILLDRGVGAVGVGVAPATVKGVRDLPPRRPLDGCRVAHPWKKYGGLTRSSSTTPAEHAQPGGSTRSASATPSPGRQRF